MTLTTDRDVPVTGEQIADRLAGVCAELDIIARAPFTQLQHEEACQVASSLERLTRGLEGVHSAAVSGLAAGTGWAASGYQSFPVFWSAHTHRRKSTSRAAWYRARDLAEHLPLTRQAVQEGRIGGEHVNVLTRLVTKTPAQRERLADPEVGERFLLSQAARLPVELFTGLVKEWAIRADPAAADRGWREEGARAELYLSKVLDGADVRGWLGTEGALVFEEALRAITGTPGAADERTPAQRRADALIHLCRHYLDSGQGQPGARIRPHIAITIDYSTLAGVLAAAGGADTRTGTGSGAGTGADVRDAFSLLNANANGSGNANGNGNGNANGNGAGGRAAESECAGVLIPGGLDYDQLAGVAPASFADGTPIPHGQLAKLLCDGELHRVIFGPEGEVLDSGRTQRLFTPGQTRAVIARDEHCQYPGCTAPPWQGEIHHSIWWYHQGRTSTENAILVCWYHHTYVHQHHLTITRRTRGPVRQRARGGQRLTGEWVFTRPDGRIITPAAPPGGPAPPVHTAGSGGPAPPVINDPPAPQPPDPPPE